MPFTDGAARTDDPAPPVGDIAPLPDVAERIGHRPLTVLLAPAGFGKTTVLRRLLDRSDGMPVVLVSCDALTQPSAIDFAEAVIKGAHSLGGVPSRAQGLTGLIPPAGQELGSEFVDALIDLLHGVEQPFSLLIDDVHLLPRRVELELGRLVSMVATSAHRIVVATRREPPWSLPRSRVAGFVDLITADDLLLTPAAIAGILDADEDLVARTVEATGGWAAAVEAVRWRRELDPAWDVEAAVLDLAEYVRAEMLPTLTAVDTRVLTRTSILEPFPVSVAVTVSGVPEAARSLARTVRNTSLVTRLADGRYRLHPVLREALRTELLESPGESERELHLLAAAAWLDEPDSFEALANAVHHLLEAHAWNDATRLLSSRWADIDRASRLDSLVTWLDAIPAQYWRQDAELMILHGWASLRVGRVAHALADLQHPTVARNPEARALSEMALASSIAWGTDPRESLKLVSQARPGLASMAHATGDRAIPMYPGITSPLLAADVSAAQAYVMLGRFDEAIKGLSDALERRTEIAPTTQVSLNGALAFALAMNGDVAAAVGRSQEARRIAVETGTAEHIRLVPALVASAAIAVMTGDRQVALDHLSQASRLCRAVRATNLLRMCNLVAAMSGAPATKAADGGGAAPLPLVDQFVLAASARTRARAGDLAGAETELKATTPHELTMSAWVEVLLALRDRRFVRRWLNGQATPRSLHGRIVRWLAEAAVSDERDLTTQRAFAAAEAAAPGRLIGVLADAPRQLLEGPDAARFSHPVLLEAMELRALQQDTHGVPFLTPREIDLLRLLPLSLSVTEVAARLFVSTSTVKWHRANLYRKLGVTHRNDAIDAAVKRGLMPERRVPSLQESTSAG